MLKKGKDSYLTKGRQKKDKKKTTAIQPDVEYDDEEGETTLAEKKKGMKGRQFNCNMHEYTISLEAKGSN